MRLNGFDLNQLVCLKALLVEQNVTRAAEQMHLSQSAMSTILGHLRRHFNDPLLARSGRLHLLTPFAKSLIAPLNKMIAQAYDFAALRPGELQLDVEREIRVVASDYAIRTILDTATRQVQNVFRNVRLDVLPLSERSPRLLASGEVDLVLSGQSFDIGVTPSTCVLEDQYVCIACSKMGPSGGKLLPQEFANSEHVVVRYFDQQMTFEDEDALRKAGVVRTRRITTWSHTQVASLVCGTPMLATVPARIAYDFAKRWPIKILPFPFMHEPIRVFAYWHPSRNQDAILSALVDAAKSMSTGPNIGF
ncbi:MAG: LysR family transcriptional regulator [Planktomarina sp.]|nr:LysR family transcriptional regulator [Planktomarina sp.]MDT2073865.1 LysR family transcriptional regulator [Planktomarina sp.]MDT2077861.1 LysR family transcriptional regulator [Planktomarina sp.]|tara:strand:- start:221 stop:1138 length:918 start_codon:yes stop_codon:yes gene_type:complete